MAKNAKQKKIEIEHPILKDYNKRGRRKRHGIYILHNVLCREFKYWYSYIFSCL